MSEIEVLDGAERPFYTTRSLARRLSVNERTVTRLLKNSEIPSYSIGSARRIDPDDVDRYLARNRTKGKD
ncbi:MAG TPA: helix-turn-helix domain-containing protein [Solirubrobacterales bacterium]|nr:helix-turn-helix domain-containing protein [Solirubrobacterales bacterium]